MRSRDEKEQAILFIKLAFTPLCALIVASLFNVAARGPTPPVSFSRDVAPILNKQCVNCHGALQQKGELRVDSYESLMKGGESGPSVIARNSKKSLLVAYLLGAKKPRMPMNAPPLPAADIATIRRWIDAGARADADSQAGRPASASKSPAPTMEQRHIDIHFPAQAAVPAELVPTTFYKDVFPVINANCLGCHSREKRSGDLVLESFDALMSSSAKGPVIVPGKSSESRLIKRLEGVIRPQMPMGDNAKPLPPDVIARIKKWIDEGAKRGIEGRTSASLEIAAKIGPLPAAAALAFTDDGKWLAQGTFGKVVLWEVETGKIVRSLTDVAGYVHTVQFSPDGKHLAAGGGLPARHGEVKIFDTTSWTVTQTLKEHLDVVYDLAHSRDGARLITASLDKTAKVWDTSTGKLIYHIKDSADAVNACAFAPDGNFYTASSDRSVRVFNGQTGKSFRTYTGHGLPVIALALSPDGKSMISSGEEPGLRWWNLTEGTTLRNAGGHGVAVYEVTFSQDGTLVASAGADQTVRLWNGANGAAIRTLTGATDWVYSVAISPDNRRVAGGTADGRVLLWDPASGRLLAVLATHPAKPSTDWIVTTPGGYFDASPEMLRLISFRVAGEAVPSAPFLSALHNPDAVTRSLRGETVEASKIAATK